MAGRQAKEPKRPHVKKPLNAFMLFMKEQRPKIAAEYTLKESAAINQILGKRVSVIAIFDFYYQQLFIRFFYFKRLMFVCSHIKSPICPISVT